MRQMSGSIFGIRAYALPDPLPSGKRKRIFLDDVGWPWRTSDRRFCEAVAEGGLFGLVFASVVGCNVIFGNSDLLCDDGKDLF